MIKKNTKVFLFTIFLLVNFSTFGQNIRGFYITGIGTWLGNSTKETAILKYAQGNGYNYINFYDLGSINWSSSTEKNQLASFLSRGRTEYGITQFGAVVEIYSFFLSNILPYNKSRTNANEKFDVINLEFEFWVSSSISSSYCSKFLSPAGYSCDTAGAFKFAWKQFKLIDSACAALGLISEVYLGWPNKGQMQKLASIADRILLHAYRPTDSDVYSYSKNRLINIASVGASKKVIPLFSGEPSFMGPWLSSHPITRPYQTYASNLAAETSSFKNNINLQGYHWFTYDDMPKTILATATISASGPLTFCSGGNVVLTANSGSAYLWAPGGATTRSITVTSPGSYTVKVTNSSGVSITSSPKVVTLSTVGIKPTVTASGPVSFCLGGVVTLTSSDAGSYLWSNGSTNRTITVSVSGNYSVTTGSGSCSATSSTVIVNANSSPPVPTVTVSGSLSICQGNQLTLTSSASNGYLWSTGETTRSIAVSVGGDYTVRVYNGPNCSAQSAVSTVIVQSAPATPVITANGSTELSMVQPTVILSSTLANSYLWSTGETTRSITVAAAGNYTVNVFNAPDCFSTSFPVTITMEISTGINGLNTGTENINFSLFPNPASEEFNILFTIDKRRKVILTLIDVTGREILTREITGLEGENRIKIFTNELSSGIYFTRIITGNQRQMIKVIIE